MIIEIEIILNLKIKLFKEILVIKINREMFWLKILIIQGIQVKGLDSYNKSIIIWISIINLLVEYTTQNNN